MRKAFIVCRKKLTSQHYTSLALEDARTAVKIPITMTMVWKKWPDVSDGPQKLQELIDWLKVESQSDDYLVLEGADDAVEHLYSAGLAMGLIPLRPSWSPDELREMASDHRLPTP